MTDTYVNRNIKKFMTDGVAKDQEAILRIRPELEARLVEDMRSKGYVPVLDITPELFWEFQVEKENFKFAIVVYGSYIGKRKAKQILGLLGSHPIFLEPHKNDES